MSSTRSPTAPITKKGKLSTILESESSGDESQHPSQDDSRPKKFNSDRDESGDRIQPVTAKYVILHTVLCPRSPSAHSDHPGTACFLDTPSLDRGDSKASPLRGKHEITDAQSYLEDFPQTSFVIERTYNCAEFHDELEKSGEFHKIDVGPISAKVSRKLRPYLFVLQTRARQPEATREIMSIPASGALENALTSFLSEDSISRDALVAPYLQFYHARRMRKTVEGRLSPQARLELGALYGYLEKEFGDEYAEADNLFSQGFFTKRHFLKLFGPGDILVNTEKSDPVAMLANRIVKREKTAIIIDCETWSFDGAFEKVIDAVRISTPSKYHAYEKIPITALKTSPLHFNPSTLRDTLQQRGEIFWKCRRPTLVTYNSPTRGFDTHVPNPRCMIDMFAYNYLHGESEDDSEDGGDESHSRITAQDDPPADPFLLLLPPTIQAFNFHDKKWRTLAVKHIKPVTWNKAAFERLVLKQDKKDLVQAVVMNHLEAGKMADAIEGKGNGLVILLHGGPGTGKTFTAEGVAEIAERPLYRLTCGDIGTEPETVEKSLENIFFLGTVSKAVVVLDEAEVFLEERTQADLQRNALVSVFLRALEYYDGILILTTNRVGTFDEAFKSRIHLALHYPPLGNDDRWQIWSNFIQALKDEETAEDKIEINHAELRRKVDAFARHKLNGRQIRNSVRTAKQLARFKREVMSSTHIERTIGVIKEFEKYIVDTHGHTDADWVESGRIRIDKEEDQD